MTATPNSRTAAIPRPTLTGPGVHTWPGTNGHRPNGIDRSAADRSEHRSPEADRPAERPAGQLTPAQVPDQQAAHTGTSAGRAPRRVRLASALSGVAGVVAALGTVSVAAAAFALSFDAIRDTAVAAHVRPSLAWLLPVSVDGAMAVAVVCAVLLRQMRRPAWYPWTVVLAGAGISMVCNALHAYVAGGTIALPREWAMAISSVPAVLLAMSVHLVVVLAEAVTHVARPAGSSTARRAAAGDARSARRPSPQQAPADRPPASAPVTGGRTATRAVQQRRGPAGHPGGKPSVAQMADAVTAQFGPVKVIKKDAMAAVKQAFGSCSDDRARAARDEHNRRHGYLGEVEP